MPSPIVSVTVSVLFYSYNLFCVDLSLCVPTETLKLLQRLLKSPGCRKIPVLVQNKDDVIVTASNFSSER